MLAVSAVTDVVSTRVYSDVPQKPTFPFITVDMEVDNYGTKSSQMVRHRIIVNGFSREKSPKESLDIQQAVFAALSRQESSITLDSGNLILVEFQTGDMFKEPDGVTWHSVCILNAITSE